MHKAQEQVRDFKFRVAGSDLISPAFPKIRNGENHARHVLEEAVEAAVGLAGAKFAREVLVHELTELQGHDDAPDLVEALDGLCDSIYVDYNAAESIGVDLEPYFELVHTANMKKVRATGEHQWKGVAKPPGWQDPKKAIRTLIELTQVESWERRYRR